MRPTLGKACDTAGAAGRAPPPPTSRTGSVTARCTHFDGLEIAYDDGVLEPRDWTVEQSRWAIDLLAELPDGPVLELCSGAGQIGLVVAVGTGRLVVQVDGDEEACAFARRNAEVNAAVADVRCAPLEAALAEEERFHLVLADPPYVPAGEVDRFPEDPADTIDGGADGLDVARACLGVASPHLHDGGYLLLQLGGERQAATISQEAPGFEPVETRSFGPDRSLLLLRRRQPE